MWPMSEFQSKYALQGTIFYILIYFSNIQTKCVKSYADHPVRQFFDAGMVVVPCTDKYVIYVYYLLFKCFRIWHYLV